MAYTPRPYLGGDLAQYLADELQAIAQAQYDTVSVVNLTTLYAEPKKPREGDIVKADGTTWDPGSGAGIYGYVGGSWVKGF